MSDERAPSDPHVLDQPWRIWSTIAVMGILLVGILLGVVVIPIVQGWGAGLDAYTAICRALGILPGSPAQPQPSDRTPPTPVSQVIWTPEVLQILARADVAKGRAKVAGGVRCLPRRNRRFAVPGFSASRGAVGGRDLQAALRLPDRQPRPSADDGRSRRHWTNRSSPTLPRIMRASRNAIRIR